MEDHQEYLEFAKDLAQKAGEIMLRYYNAKDIGTITKYDNTPLTLADTGINQLVIDRVKEVYPDHGVLGEEDSFNTDSEYLWVCDPIDGTIPYSRGIPTFMFSLALVHKGKTVVGVLYSPVTNQLATAMLGQGAYVNEKLIKLRDDYPHIGKPVVVADIWMGGKSTLFNDPELPGRIVNALHADYNSVGFCSTTYTGLLLAMGSINGFVIPACSAWDFAAMDIIMREAGAVVADCFGDTTPQDYSKELTKGMIAARNQSEYEQLAERVLPILEVAKRNENHAHFRH